MDLNSEEKAVLENLLGRAGSAGMAPSFWLRRSASYAATLFIGLLIGISLRGGSFDTSFLTGDITGTGLTEGTRGILAGWIEDQEQENSDHYTFSLLEKIGQRRTYLAECRDAFIGTCKYNLVFIELNEKTGEILNVELPHD